MATWYEREFSRPTREQIVAKAIAKLKRDLAALRARSSLEGEE